MVVVIVLVAVGFALFRWLDGREAEREHAKEEAQKTICRGIAQGLLSDTAVNTGVTIDANASKINTDGNNTEDGSLNLTGKLNGKNVSISGALKSVNCTTLNGSNFISTVGSLKYVADGTTTPVQGSLTWSQPTDATKGEPTLSVDIRDDQGNYLYGSGQNGNGEAIAITGTNTIFVRLPEASR